MNCRAIPDLFQLLVFAKVVLDLVNQIFHLVQFLIWADLIYTKVHLEFLFAIAITLIPQPCFFLDYVFLSLLDTSNNTNW